MKRNKKMYMYARYSNDKLFIKGRPFSEYKTSFTFMMTADFVIKCNKNSNICEVIKCRSGAFNLNKKYDFKEVMDYIKEFYKK